MRPYSTCDFQDTGVEFEQGLERFQFIDSMNHTYKMTGFSLRTAGSACSAVECVNVNRPRKRYVGLQNTLIEQVNLYVIYLSVACIRFLLGGGERDRLDGLEIIVVEIPNTAS